MSSKLEEKRLKLAAQGLRKTAISLQASVVSLLQVADALTAETDDNLVENNPLDVSLQDLLKGDINGVIGKFLNDALNNEGEDDDQKAQNGRRTANGVKKTTRKPRPPRDPNAPTRPQNAFILYQKDVSSEVKAEHKGKPWSEIVHLISERWRSLPKDEREVYESKFEEAKKQYEADYKAYMENKGQVAVAEADGHGGNHESTSSPTASSASVSSRSDEEDEEDDMPMSRSSRSRAKPSKNASTSQTNPESSSKKASKKRRPHDGNDNESAHEEEEDGSPKKSKKKTSNEEGSEMQGKERKKIKKSSREEEKDSTDVGLAKKKKAKKSKQE